MLAVTVTAWVGFFPSCLEQKWLRMGNLKWIFSVKTTQKKINNLMKERQKERNKNFPEYYHKIKQKQTENVAIFLLWSFALVFFSLISCEHASRCFVYCVQTHISWVYYVARHKHRIAVLWILHFKRFFIARFFSRVCLLLCWLVGLVQILRLGEYVFAMHKVSSSCVAFWVLLAICFSLALLVGSTDFVCHANDLFVCCLHKMLYTLCTIQPGRVSR